MNFKVICTKSAIDIISFQYELQGTLHEARQARASVAADLASGKFRMSSKGGDGAGDHDGAWDGDWDGDGNWNEDWNDESDDSGGGDMWDHLEAEWAKEHRPANMTPLETLQYLLTTYSERKVIIANQNIKNMTLDHVRETIAAHDEILAEICEIGAKLGLKSAHALDHFWADLLEHHGEKQGKGDGEKQQKQGEKQGKDIRGKRHGEIQKQEKKDRHGDKHDHRDKHDDEDDEEKPLLPLGEDSSLARKKEKARMLREQLGHKDRRGGRHRDRHGDRHGDKSKSSPSDGDKWKSSQHRRKSRASILHRDPDARHTVIEVASHSVSEEDDSPGKKKKIRRRSLLDELDGKDGKKGSAHDAHDILFSVLAKCCFWSVILVLLLLLSLGGMVLFWKANPEKAPAWALRWVGGANRDGAVSSLGSTEEVLGEEDEGKVKRPGKAKKAKRKKGEKVELGSKWGSLRKLILEELEFNCKRTGI